jgi:hypothetical protein
MERLTKRIGSYISYSDFNSNNSGSCCESMDNCLHKLADYEDAEENGLLIRLPCKVGDTVYTPCSWGIEYGVVGSIEVFSDRIFVNNIHGSMIGEAKSVFLTKAEAEQALAKMKGE